MDTQPDNIKTEMEQWRATRERLRQQLQKELAEVRARANELEIDLDELNGSGSTATRTRPPRHESKPPPRKERKVTGIPGLTLEVLKAAKQEMDAAQVVAAVQSKVGTAKYENIASALYRLGKAKKIKISGSKGSMRYAA